MVTIFAHESAANHIHTSDSTSPAIYIGAILVAVSLLIIAILLLIITSSNKNKSVKEQDKN